MRSYYHRERTRTERRTQWVVAFLVVMSFALGCSSEDGGTDPGPPRDLVAEGWNAFERDDFVTAAARFQAAIGEDATNAEAHNGLGWASANLADFQNAVDSYDEALTRGFGGADPYAGRAVILRDLIPVDYQLAIDSADAALSIAPQYQFAHDAEMDWRDLRLVIAQAHFALARYDLANAQVALLGGTVQDSGSVSFVADLLTEIERLGDLIGNN